MLTPALSTEMVEKEPGSPGESQPAGQSVFTSSTSTKHSPSEHAPSLLIPRVISVGQISLTLFLPPLSFPFPFSSYPFSLLTSSPTEYTVAWFSRYLCLSLQRDGIVLHRLEASLPPSLWSFFNQNSLITILHVVAPSISSSIYIPSITFSLSPQ